MINKDMIKYQIHLFFRWLLPYIALMHPKNWKYDRKSYPQMWHLWGKYLGYRNKKRKFIERICGLLTGHEPSKTEWGYGGGNYVDRWCRWCDKLMKVHKLEEKLPDALGEAADMLGFREDDFRCPKISDN